MGNKFLINSLAFFSSRLLNVFGATTAEKKIRLPIKKGIKKAELWVSISIIIFKLLLYFKKKTMVVKNKYEFKIYIINTYYWNPSFRLVWRFFISQKSKQREERKDENDKVIVAEYRDLDEDRWDNFWIDNNR